VAVAVAVLADRTDPAALGPTASPATVVPVNEAGYGLDRRSVSVPAGAVVEITETGSPCSRVPVVPEEVVPAPAVNEAPRATAKPFTVPEEVAAATPGSRDFREATAGEVR